MLSIGIPVFNYSVYALVNDLLNQCVAADIEFEIIVLEDGSTLFLEENKRLETLHNIKYTALAKNVGRARIRNQLAEQARFKHILFLDCDSAVTKPDFISTYIKCDDFDVVCGGRIYPEKVSSEFALHKKYGENREFRPLKDREANPYSNFMTNNFMISKSVFESIRFDESLAGYGHEDRLFGWELQKRNAKIKHIDNPVMHVGLDANEKFISKSLKGLENGWNLYNFGKLPADKIRAIVRFEQLKKAGLENFVARHIRKRQDRLVKNLCGNAPNLRNLDLLKLLMLCDKEEQV